MKPTIGRIVHYKLTAEDRQNLATLANISGRYSNTASGYNNEPVAAIITAVWSETTINVQLIIDGHANTLWKTSINQGDGNGQWSWPPRE